MTMEYRAVFGDPHGRRTYGRDTHETMRAAADERPERPEETLESVVGVQERKVEPWADVPLIRVIKEVMSGDETVASAPRAVRDQPQA